MNVYRSNTIGELKTIENKVFNTLRELDNLVYNDNLTSDRLEAAKLHLRQSLMNIGSERVKLEREA
jgi:hypothetical protein